MSDLCGIIAEVAALIARGGFLLAPRVSVGPIYRAVGRVYWACVEDPGGVERIGCHRVPEIDSWGEIDTYIEDDPSSFGAARMFVHLVGEDGARAALKAHNGVDEEDGAKAFGMFAEACAYRVTPPDPAPIKGRLAALHVATVGPFPRCKLKPPKTWPEGMVGRWLGSGGGAEVLGPCSGNCPEKRS